jgi:hypothetical protein
MRVFRWIKRGTREEKTWQISSCAIDSALYSKRDQFGRKVDYPWLIIFIVFFSYLKLDQDSFHLYNFQYIIHHHQNMWRLAVCVTDGVLLLMCCLRNDAATSSHYTDDWTIIRNCRGCGIPFNGPSYWHILKQSWKVVAIKHPLVLDQRVLFLF